MFTVPLKGDKWDCLHSFEMLLWFTIHWTTVYSLLFSEFIFIRINGTTRYAEFYRVISHCKRVQKISQCFLGLTGINLIENRLREMNYLLLLALHSGIVLDRL